MKVLVVTVYNSHNCGSFLQAYALQQVLMALGHEVAFLKRDVKKSSHDKYVVALKTLKAVIKFKPIQAYYTIKQWSEYEKLQQTFKIVDIRSDYFKQVECIILGSDTIWNFEAAYFLKHSSVYLGATFEGKKVISYAASIGNTSERVFKDVIARSGEMKNISSLLVRDQYTKNVIKSTTGLFSYVVVDPTLIVNKNVFDIFNNKKIVGRKYLLLYFYGQISSKLRKQILIFARHYSLDIVSMPNWRGWCSYSALSIPQNFIPYFSSAYAVITNTFHGVAFSMIYNKTFAVYDMGKNKVRDILETFNETERLFVCEDLLPEILDKENDVTLSERLYNKRNFSLSLIIDALNDERA